MRNAPEKLFVTQFAELMPPTLITYRHDEIKAFRAEHKDIIVKPIYGNGGAGVFHIDPDDENLNSLLDLLAQTVREPLMVQRYIPEIKQGDKRIVLIEGEPGGAVNRIPPRRRRARQPARRRPRPEDDLVQARSGDLRGARPGAAGSRGWCSSAST